MTKIVYNACWGGFGLSDEAIARYAELKNVPYEDVYDYDIDRDDPILVQVVEELGEEASASCADLRIEDLARGTMYRIDEYDGMETIRTLTDYDWKIA